MGFFSSIFGGKKDASSEVKSVDSCRSVFASAGFSDLFDKLKPLARKCVDIKIKETSDEKIGLGLSKWEGKPDLPKGMSWPADATGSPLLFLCQVSLQEVASADSDCILPKSGLLSFFVSFDGSFSGYNPADKDCFRVVFTENMANLERKPLPDALPLDSVSGRISFASNFSFPSPLSDQFANLGYELKGESWSRYSGLASTSANHVLGYPNQLQESMEKSCELVRQEFNLTEVSVDYRDPRNASLFLHKDDWVLLLEVDMESVTGAVNNEGILYFWIRKQDLAAKSFDKAWCVWQTT